MSSALLSRHLAAAAVLAFATLGAASSAHARSDVSFSIGIQVPGAYVQPAPFYAPPPRVYYQPPPVYYQPQPSYYQSQPGYYQSQPSYYQSQPVYVQPRPVFVQPSAYGIYYRSGPDWRRNQWERDRRHGHRDHDDDRRGRRD